MGRPVRRVLRTLIGLGGRVVAAFIIREALGVLAILHPMAAAGDVPMLNLVVVYSRAGLYLLMVATVVLCLYVATRWE